MLAIAPERTRTARGPLGARAPSRSRIRPRARPGSTTWSSSAGLAPSRPRQAQRVCSWPARSASARATARAATCKPGELVADATSRSTLARSARRSCRAAARSSPPRSTRSASTSPAGLPRRWRLDRRLHRCACCSAARAASMLSTWATDSLPTSLRTDPRVVSMERTHAARLDPDAADHVALPEPVSLAVIDVSFISLTRVLRGMAALTRRAARSCRWSSRSSSCRPRTRRKGVVRDPAVARAAVDRVARSRAVARASTSVARSSRRCVGPAGNLEFLLHLACRPMAP